MEPVHAKISMLGYTGSGKTCFMYGMYAVMRKVVEGFLLGTKDPDDDLEFREAWRQIKLGQLPLGNDNVPKSYRFDFRYAMKPLMEFEWIDHRGGVLTGKTGENDVQAIHKHVSESDCIFLCISGEHLAESVKGRRDEVVEDAYIDRMHFFLRDTPLMPMVLLITKADLIRHRPSQEIVDDVRRIYDIYFKTDRLIMICPVSIGTGFGNPSSSIVIQPQAVDLPFIFVLYTILKKSSTSGRVGVIGSNSISRPTGAT